MEELKIIGFENAVVDLCNKTPIPWRTKYYILKELSQKCFEASDKDYQAAMKSLQEKQDIDKENEQKGGGE